MRAALAVVMFANAGLFFFAAIQHAGTSIQKISRAVILIGKNYSPAMEEIICGNATL